MSYKKGVKRLAAIAISAGVIAPIMQPTVVEAAKKENSTIDFRIMATTDLHANIMDHDYFTDKQDPNMGLSRLSTIIEKSKKEVDKDTKNKNIDNSILVDNGDVIQGNPLSTVYAMNEETKVKPGEKYPVYEALDILGYDATTLGNHEFNYGLDFLKQITKKNVMKTNVVNANVLDNNGKNIFNPYNIINETVIDSNGKKQKVKIGITGVVPPQILNWDKKNLQGKVKVEDMKTSVEKITKELKEKHKVDIVIALAHTGTGESDEHIMNSENAAYQLTKVKGLDVVVAGHSHSTTQTEMNGVQIIQPANWGKELGIVDLKLEQKGKTWVVNDKESKVSRKNVKELKPENNPIITENKDLKKAHEATIEFINKPVGETTKELNSFFSLVSDNESVELVAQAQKWYAKNKIEQGQDELKQYKDLPILSAAAPFKAGGREFNDATNYVDIKSGELKIKDLSNLYVYDNTISILKINGAQIKEWLEMTSGMYNTINPTSNEDQQLFNPGYRSYNFDSIEGLTYEIDVTKKAKYDSNGNTINQDSQRISNLKHNGKNLDPNQEFLVVTNNYRASGTFPGIKDAQVVYSSPDENRQAVMDYIKETGKITPSKDNNWKIKPVKTNAKVLFNSHKNGESYLNDIPSVKKVKDLDNEMATYAYDLSKGEGDKNTVDVQLLSFNDLHGQFDVDSKLGGGIDNLSAYLKKLQSENKNTLTLSAGDAVGGSPAVTALKQDQPTLEIMKEMNVDVVTTGNHEYDEGTSELARIIQGGTHSSGLNWEGSQNFNWVTANVVANKDMKFGNKEVKKGEPILSPYTIKEFDGVKVGVIGIVTTDTARKVVPEGIKDVDFIDEVSAIDKYTKELQQQGVKTIIVLSHVPALTDKDTGKLVDLEGSSDIYDISQKINDEVDVIMAADNHQFANSVVKREGKDDIVVTQAYSKSTNISDIDLVIDKESGDVVSSKSEILPIDPKNISADKAATLMVQKAREDVKPLLERKVGFAEEFISRNIEGANGESELGRMIADAQLWAAKEKGEDVQISMMNIGGVRADLQQGDVTYEDVYTIQPFGNDLTKLTLSGSQLKTILETQNIHDWVIGMQQGKYNRPRMLQVEGFTYKWHPELVNGNWVVKVDSINLKDENKTQVTDDMKINTVANIFLAQGGDGFTTFKEAKYEVIMSDLEAFEKYTEAFSKLDSDNDGTTGLNKPDINKNPNLVNLDQNFDGKID